MNCFGESVQNFNIDGNGILSASFSTQITECYPYSICWSPNSDFIVVANFNSNSIQTFSVDATGTLSSVISTQTTGMGPSSVKWSPNGDFISVVKNAPVGNNVQLFGVDALGNLLPEISLHITGTTSAGAWSPNGDFITLVSSSIDDGCEVSPGAIYEGCCSIKIAL